MNIPSSTYRIQFHKDFTFKDLHGIVDYLYELGISTIYASPILKSTKGSMHGYDGVDPRTIDPEIGTEEELRELAATLQKKGMTWLQDIVPNHMAFDSSNFRLMDVLERGPASTYYSYFDILWNHPDPDLNGKVIVPFLGDELQQCLGRKEIKLSHSKSGFRISYFDSHYPLSIPAYDVLFAVSEAPYNMKESWRQFFADHARESDHQKWVSQKHKWFSLLSEIIIRKIVDSINHDPEKLSHILSKQYYVLAYWKQTQTKLNYRRFFTINQLICLRMENDDVFREYHSYFRSLYRENIIQGCRIDHIDGLLDPSDYLIKLRGLLDDDCYIIVEKILEAKESIPSQWPIQGTSGYEFLSYVNQLLTHRKGSRQLVKFYYELIADVPRYQELVFQNKRMILETYMQGDWDNLVHYFFDLGLQQDFSFAKIKEALGLVMISLPVYRIYPGELPLSGKDLVTIKETFHKASLYASRCRSELEYLSVLFVNPERHQQEAMLMFIKRVMQFTGPLTAKGVEDSTFYVYNPLISHDEVGDSPSTLGIRTDEFHTYMKARQATTPLSLNATSTHDTKRGEDVRVRLNIISQLSEDWQRLVKQWFSINKPFRARDNGKNAPSTNDEYFIYQSIVGGFPEDLVVSDTWIKRLQEYLVKAVREAKVNSNWESPNEAYEKACADFIEKILGEDHAFLSSVVPFVRTVVTYGSIYSLAQVLIKITAPGIPDIYQGCELWDLSYVDPDNRRTVDYEKRKILLQQISSKEKEGSAPLISFLADNRAEGAEKLFVQWKALNFRKQYTLLFSEGEYLPLQVTGSETRACVFVRSHDTKFAIVIAPLGIARRGETDTENEAIVLPPSLPRSWTNYFTGKVLTSEDNLLPLAEVLAEFPVALLVHV